MKNIKFATFLSCLLVAETALPIISCSKNFSVGWTLTGGSTKIIVDQTKGTCRGTAPLKWTLKHNGEAVTNDNDFVWEKIGDSDNNISVVNGQISWNMPKLVNHTFRIRASKMDDDGHIVEAFSDEISLLADERTFKFEILNSVWSENTTINAVAHKAGSQDSVWQMYLNGSPYYGSHDDFQFYDQLGNPVTGLKSGSDGKICWDQSLSQCDKEVYFYTKITEKGILQDYVFVSANPINLHVSNNWLNLSSTTSRNVKIEQTREYLDFLKWNVINSKSQDITDDITTEWSIIDVPLTLGISINKGRVSFSGKVPAGTHQFRIQVVDKTQITETGEYRSIISEPITVECYSAISVVSPTTKIDGIINKITSCSLPWTLKTGNTIVIADKFEIVDYDPALEGKIFIEKSLGFSQNTDEWYNAYIKWDNSLSTGSYKFKVAGTYKEKIYKSEEITLFISLSEKIHLINNFSSVALYKDSSNVNDTTEYNIGKLERAFYVSYQNKYIDLYKVDFTISGAPDVLNFRMKLHGYYGSLSWDNISKYDGPDFNVIITASYYTGTYILTDEINIEFKINSASSILNLHKPSYNYYSTLFESSFFPLDEMIVFDYHEWEKKEEESFLDTFSADELAAAKFKLYFEPQASYNKVGDYIAGKEWWDTHYVWDKGERYELYGGKGFWKKNPDSNPKFKELQQKYWAKPIPYYSEAPLKSLDDCYKDCFFKLPKEPIFDRSTQVLSLLNDSTLDIPGYHDIDSIKKPYYNYACNFNTSIIQYQPFALTLAVPPMTKIGLNMDVDFNLSYSLKDGDKTWQGSKTHTFFYTYLHQIKNLSSDLPEYLTNVIPFDESIIDHFHQIMENNTRGKFSTKFNLNYENNRYIKDCNKKDDLWFINKTSDTRNITLYFGISFGIWKHETQYALKLSTPPSYKFKFLNQYIESLR